MAYESSLKSMWIRLTIFIALIVTGTNIVSALESCCFSLVSSLKSSPDQYQINVTASHVNLEKHNNEYSTAISFPQGYVVQDSPSSPFSFVDCTVNQQISGTQYECQEKVDGVFFVQFTVQISQLPANTSPSASVIIFGDTCQQDRYCTNLSAASDNSNNISLGPLGTWPKYVIIICGVILGLAIVGACYLIYRRNVTAHGHKDTSVTPGYSNKRFNSIFNPSSLLRNGADDDDEPPPEFPKNTLIQFDNETSDIPQPNVHNRVKSVKKSTNDVDRRQDSLKKKSISRPSKERKNEKNRSEMDTYTENPTVRSQPSDGHLSHVVVDMNYGHSHNNNRKSNDHKKLVSSTNKDPMIDSYSSTRISKGSSDLSRSASSRARDYEGVIAGVKNEEYETRKEIIHGRHDSLPREHYERKSRKMDNTTSKKHRSISGPHRSNSLGQERSDITRSRSHKSPAHELQRGNSMRTRRNDRDDQQTRDDRHHAQDLAGKSQDLNFVKSTREKGLSPSTSRVSKSKNGPSTKRGNANHEATRKNNSDIDSTASSSDAQASDKLPLALIASRNKDLPTNTRNTLTQEDDDDDNEPLGSILNTTSSSNTGGLRTSVNKGKSSNNDLLTGKSEPDYYDSVLDEMLDISDYRDSERSSHEGSEEEEEYPIGKILEKKRNESSSEDEVPIGVLKSR